MPMFHLLFHGYWQCLSDLCLPSSRKKSSNKRFQGPNCCCWSGEFKPSEKIGIFHDFSVLPSLEVRSWLFKTALMEDFRSSPLLPMAQRAKTSGSTFISFSWYMTSNHCSSTVQTHRTAEAPLGRFGTTYYIILLQQQRAGCHSWLFDLASTRRTARWSRPSAEQSQGNKTGQAVKSVSPMSIAWMFLHTSFLALLTYLPYYLLTCTYWLVSRHSAK